MKSFDTLILAIKEKKMKMGIVCFVRFYYIKSVKIDVHFCAGRSAVRSARMLREHEVESSNLSAPTDRHL